MMDEAFPVRTTNIATVPPSRSDQTVLISSCESAGASVTTLLRYTTRKFRRNALAAGTLLRYVWCEKDFARLMFIASQMGPGSTSSPKRNSTSKRVARLCKKSVVNRQLIYNKLSFCTSWYQKQESFCSPNLLTVSVFISDSGPTGSFIIYAF